MSELPFPENHHLSLPHVRLSKKTFLVFEKDQIYYTKLQSGQSDSTPIIHRSEICKLEVEHFINYRTPSLLLIYIIPQAGMKKIYEVRPKKFVYHTQEQWTQISDFFLALDFHPSPVPAGKSLRNAHNSTKFKNIYRYFPVGDRLFDLCKDPEFKQTLESLKTPFLPWFFFTSGVVGLVVSLAFALGVIDPGIGAFWIPGLASLSCLGYGITKIRQYRKKENDFSQKYNLPCYFK